MTNSPAPLPALRPAPPVSATIRPIEAGDRDAWRRLFTAYGVFYETEFRQSVLDGDWAWLMDAAHDVSALVAELDGAVVGFAHPRRPPGRWTTCSSCPSIAVRASPAS